VLHHQITEAAAVDLIVGPLAVVDLITIEIEITSFNFLIHNINNTALNIEGFIVTIIMYCAVYFKLQLVLWIKEAAV
jgi:hypothetical protein